MKKAAYAPRKARKEKDKKKKKKKGKVKARDIIKELEALADAQEQRSRLEQAWLPDVRGALSGGAADGAVSALRDSAGASPILDAESVATQYASFWSGGGGLRPPEGTDLDTFFETQVGKGKKKDKKDKGSASTGAPAMGAPPLGTGILARLVRGTADDGDDDGKDAALEPPPLPAFTAYALMREQLLLQRRAVAASLNSAHADVRRDQLRARRLLQQLADMHEDEARASLAAKLDLGPEPGHTTSETTTVGDAKVPRVVGLGVSAIFSFLSATAQDFPQLCAQPLRSLAIILSGFAPQTLLQEGGESISALTRLLRDLARPGAAPAVDTGNPSTVATFATDIDVTDEQVLRKAASLSITDAALTALMGLAVSRGSILAMIAAVQALTEHVDAEHEDAATEDAPAAQLLVPAGLRALARLALGVDTASVSDTVDLFEQSLAACWSVSVGIGARGGAGGADGAGGAVAVAKPTDGLGGARAVACDGSHLFIAVKVMDGGHGSINLYKVGTGFSGTTEGRVYAELSDVAPELVARLGGGDAGPGTADMPMWLGCIPLPDRAECGTVLFRHSSMRPGTFVAVDASDFGNARVVMQTPDTELSDTVHTGSGAGAAAAAGQGASESKGDGDGAGDDSSSDCLVGDTPYAIGDLGAGRFAIVSRSAGHIIEQLTVPARATAASNVTAGRGMDVSAKLAYREVMVTPDGSSLATQRLSEISWQPTARDCRIGIAGFAPWIEGKNETWTQSLTTAKGSALMVACITGSDDVTVYQTVDGGVWAVGSALPFGRAGVFSTPTKLDAVVASKGSVILGSHARHSLVLCDDGNLLAAGANDAGQCGTGKKGEKPVQLKEVDVSHHGAKKKKKKEKKAKMRKGKKSKHKDDDDDDDDDALPDDAFVVAAAVRDQRSVAITRNGKVHAWGGDWGDSPKVLHSLSGGGADVSKIAMGKSHVLVLRESGTIHAFGDNPHGQSGTKGGGGGLNEVTIDSVDGTIVDVAAGENHSLFLSSSGQVFSCGLNEEGQLGLGHTTNADAPTRVKLPGRAVAISAGVAHSVAVLDSGLAYAWGRSVEGQVGAQLDEGAAFVDHPVAVTAFGGDQCPLRMVFACANRTTVLPAVNVMAPDALATAAVLPHGRDGLRVLFDGQAAAAPGAAPRTEGPGAAESKDGGAAPPGDAEMAAAMAAAEQAEVAEAGLLEAIRKDLTRAPKSLTSRIVAFGSGGGIAANRTDAAAVFAGVDPVIRSDLQGTSVPAICSDAQHEAIWAAGAPVAQESAGSSEVSRTSIAAVARFERVGGDAAATGFTGASLLSTPTYALPAAPTAAIRAAEATVTLLSCVDALSERHAAGVAAVGGSVDVKAQSGPPVAPTSGKGPTSLAGMVAVGEPTLCKRHTTTYEGWGLGGVDHVVFRTDEPVVIVGCKLYGTRGAAVGKTWICEGRSSDDKDKVCEQDFTLENSTDGATQEVLFDEPFIAEADTDYNWSEQTTSGGSGWYGGGGGGAEVSVTTDAGITFKFMQTAAPANNGTSPNNGRCPELLFYPLSAYRRVTDDSEEELVLSSAPEALPRVALQPLCAGLDGDALASLLSVVQWGFGILRAPDSASARTSPRLTAATAAVCFGMRVLASNLRVPVAPPGLTDDGADGDDADVAEDDADAALEAEIRRERAAALQELERRPPWAPRDPFGYATLVADVERVIREVLLCGEAGGIPGSAVDAARHAMITLFDRLFPTPKLKLVCIGRLLSAAGLLDTAESGAAGAASVQSDTAGVQVMLSAVLDAVATSHGASALWAAGRSPRDRETGGAAESKEGGEDEKKYEEETPGSGAAPDSEARLRQGPSYAIPAELGNTVEELLLQMYQSTSLGGESSGDALSSEVPTDLTAVLSLLSQGADASIANALGIADAATGDRAVSTGTPPYVSAAVRLLEAVLGEMVAEVSKASAATVVSVVPDAEVRTVDRYQSNMLGWGLGSPDAISFKVDDDIELVGVGMYVSQGSPTDTATCVVYDGTSEVLASFTAVEYEGRDGEPGQLMFDEPVPITAGNMYTVAVTVLGATGSSYYGNGMATVTSDDGLHWEWIYSHHSTNGTGQTSGQIPQFLYRLPSKATTAVELGDSPPTASGGTNAKARHSFIDFCRTVVRQGEELVQRLLSANASLAAMESTPAESPLPAGRLGGGTAVDAEGSVPSPTEAGGAAVYSSPRRRRAWSVSEADADAEPLSCRLHPALSSVLRDDPLVGHLLPKTLTHLGRVAAADAHAASDLLSLVCGLTSTLDAINAAELEETGSSAEGSAYRTFVLESSHPYTPACRDCHSLRFPSNVGWMVVEFDQRCATSQPEDAVTLFSDLDLRNQVGMAYSGGPDDEAAMWPRSGPILVPGNTLSVVFSVASNYDKKPAEERFGYRIRVTGHVLDRLDVAPLRTLQLEVAHVSAVCLAQSLGVVDMSAGVPDPELAVAVPRGTGNFVRLPDACLDVDSVAGSVKVHDDGVTVDGNGNGYVLLNYGISRGQIAWEVELKKEDQSQCTVLGVTNKQGINTSYNNASFYVLRCFNGNLYEAGREVRKGFPKVFKDDRVRMVLDMDEGTLTYQINDGDVLEGFTGLDKFDEVWPVIAFYSGNRQSELLYAEVAGKAIEDCGVRVPAAMKSLEPGGDLGGSQAIIPKGVAHLLRSPLFSAGRRVDDGQDVPPHELTESAFLDDFIEGREGTAGGRLASWLAAVADAERSSAARAAEAAAAKYEAWVASKSKETETAGADGGAGGAAADESTADKPRRKVKVKHRKPVTPPPVARATSESSVIGAGNLFGEDDGDDDDAPAAPAAPLARATSVGSVVDASSLFVGDDEDYVVPPVRAAAPSRDWKALVKPTSVGSSAGRALRAVYAATLWHHGVASDAVACAAYLRHHRDSSMPSAAVAEEERPTEASEPPSPTDAVRQCLERAASAAKAQLPPTLNSLLHAWRHVADAVLPRLSSTDATEEGGAEESKGDEAAEAGAGDGAPSAAFVSATGKLAGSVPAVVKEMAAKCVGGFGARLISGDAGGKRGGDADLWGGRGRGRGRGGRRGRRRGRGGADDRPDTAPFVDKLAPLVANDVLSGLKMSAPSGVRPHNVTPKMKHKVKGGCIELSTKAGTPRDCVAFAPRFKDTISEGTLGYFECVVKSTGGGRRWIAVGLAASGEEKKTVANLKKPRSATASMAWRTDSGEFVGSGFKSPLIGAVDGSSIGCGVATVAGTRFVFFTRNGAMLGVKYIGLPADGELCPFVAFGGTGPGQGSVTLNLGSMPFTYGALESLRVRHELGEALRTESATVAVVDDSQDLEPDEVIVRANMLREFVPPESYQSLRKQGPIVDTPAAATARAQRRAAEPPVERNRSGSLDAPAVGGAGGAATAGLPPPPPRMLKQSSDISGLQHDAMPSIPAPMMRAVSYDTGVDRNVEQEGSVDAPLLRFPSPALREVDRQLELGEAGAKREGDTRTLPRGLWGVVRFCTSTRVSRTAVHEVLSQTEQKGVARLRGLRAAKSLLVNLREPSSVQMLLYALGCTLAHLPERQPLPQDDDSGDVDAMKREREAIASSRGEHGFLADLVACGAHLRSQLRQALYSLLEAVSCRLVAPFDGRRSARADNSASTMTTPVLGPAGAFADNRRIADELAFVQQLAASCFRLPVGVEDHAFLHTSPLFSRLRGAMAMPPDPVRPVAAVGAVVTNTGALFTVQPPAFELGAAAEAEEGSAAVDIKLLDAVDVAPVDISQEVDIRVGCGEERARNLLESNTESYWETGQKDGPDKRWVEVELPADEAAATRTVCEVAVYVDMGRDSKYAVNAVSLRAGRSSELMPTVPLDVAAVPPKFSGWLTLRPASAPNGSPGLSKARCVRLTFASSGKCRVRALRVYASPRSSAPVPRPAAGERTELPTVLLHELAAGALGEDGCAAPNNSPASRAALLTFRQLARQVFARLRDRANAPPEPLDLERQSSELRERMAGMLFEGRGGALGGLQATLVSILVSEMRRETRTLLRKRPWAAAAGGGGSAAAAPGAAESKENAVEAEEKAEERDTATSDLSTGADAYLFELTCLLASTTNSDAGVEMFVQDPSILADVLRLLPIATPRVQRQLLTILRRALCRVPVAALDNAVVAPSGLLRDALEAKLSAAQASLKRTIETGAGASATDTGDAAEDDTTDFPSLEDLLAQDRVMATGAGSTLSVLLLTWAKHLQGQVRGKASGRAVRFKCALPHDLLPGAVDAAIAGEVLALLRDIFACGREDEKAVASGEAPGKSLKHQWARQLVGNCRTLLLTMSAVMASTDHAPAKSAQLAHLWASMAAMAVVESELSVGGEGLPAGAPKGFLAAPLPSDPAGGSGDGAAAAAASAAAAHAAAVASARVYCSNHDDGKTEATWACSECDASVAGGAAAATASDAAFYCDGCDAVLHLPAARREHQRVPVKPTVAESIAFDYKGGCARGRLAWLQVMCYDSTGMAFVEFKREGGRGGAGSGAALCRFCGTELSASNRCPEEPVSPALENVCDDEDCIDTAKHACTKTLDCGHFCGGVRGESKCLPCYEGCDGGTVEKDDKCAICGWMDLGSSPVLQLGCGHAFHAECLRGQLSARWNGPVISFGFTQCPSCRAMMEHEALEDLLAPLRELRASVRVKAVTRLRYEGKDKAKELNERGSPYYNDPEGYAEHIFAYYECFKCKKPYYGGEKACGVARGDEFDPSELICGACAPFSAEQSCDKHGTESIEWKCRYCCSIAVWFCHGTTHYCDPCHSGGSASSKPCPSVAGREVDECPLGIDHPPSGTEFALGCGICRNMTTF